MKTTAVVTGITVLIALGVSVGAGWILVRDAKSDVAADLASALALTSNVLRGDSEDALAGIDAVPAAKSAKLYRADGKLISSYTRPWQEVAFSGLAARLAGAEVTCGAVTLADGAPATLCIESSPAAIAPRVRTAVVLIAVALASALLIGFVAGRALHASGTSAIRRIADVVERAAREHSYSLRAAPEGGELGRMGASVNDLLAQMQERDVALRRRTTELEAANKDLEAFAYSVSHDLRSPLGSIDGFTQALETEYADKFDDTGREFLGWIRQGCEQMRDLIDGLLQMTRLSRAELQRDAVDLSAIARSVADSLRQANPQRPVRFQIRDDVRTIGDERLLRAVMENLISNAWKFTRHRDPANIEFGMAGDAYYVRDDGAGFDPSYAAKMFRPFQRLHSAREFEGTGIGLATVRKIIERHGGKVWAEGEVDKGATVYFTCGAVSPDGATAG